MIAQTECSHLNYGAPKSATFDFQQEIVILKGIAIFLYTKNNHGSVKAVEDRMKKSLDCMKLVIQKYVRWVNFALNY